jgi:hypothetical protein
MGTVAVLWSGGCCSEPAACFDCPHTRGRVAAGWPPSCPPVLLREPYSACVLVPPGAPVWGAGRPGVAGCGSAGISVAPWGVVPGMLLCGCITQGAGASVAAVRACCHTLHAAMVGAVVVLCIVRHKGGQGGHTSPSALATRYVRCLRVWWSAAPSSRRPPGWSHLTQHTGSGGIPDTTGCGYIPTQQQRNCGYAGERGRPPPTHQTGAAPCWCVVVTTAQGRAVAPLPMPWGGGVASRVCCDCLGMVCWVQRVALQGCCVLLGCSSCECVRSVCGMHSMATCLAPCHCRIFIPHRLLLLSGPLVAQVRCKLMACRTLRRGSAGLSRCVGKCCVAVVLQRGVCPGYLELHSAVAGWMRGCGGPWCAPHTTAPHGKPACWPGWSLQHPSQPTMVQLDAWVPTPCLSASPIPGWSHATVPAHLRKLLLRGQAKGHVPKERVGACASTCPTSPCAVGPGSWRSGHVHFDVP